MPEPTSKGLADALSAGPNPIYANRCSIGSFISSLDTNDADAMRNAVAKVGEALRTKTQQSTGYTTQWIRRIVAETGVTLSEKMLRRHCLGECSCES